MTAVEIEIRGKKRIVFSFTKKKTAKINGQPLKTSGDANEQLRFAVGLIARSRRPVVLVPFSTTPSNVRFHLTLGGTQSRGSRPMDSLIPFTTSGSLVDCVDSMSAQSPPLPCAQPSLHLPTQPPFSFFH